MFRVRLLSPLVVVILVLVLPSLVYARDDCSFASSTGATAPAIPNGFGVNIEFTDARPGELKLISTAGFRWVRIDMKWDATEVVPGQYDFAAYDRLLTALDQFGLHALFILDYGNPAYDNGQPPRTAPARQAFARWALAAAKHFAGRGVVWEIYNEPNIAQFWPPQPNAADYIALALAVGRSFRSGAPGEKLIGPATSGIDFVFLEACFKAGLLDYWAAVSVHPYRRSDPETAASDYCRLRTMIAHYAPLNTGRGTGLPGNTSTRSGPLVSTRSGSDGAPAKKIIPIISSEWGYSSAWSGSDDEKQGQLLARSWLTNTANDISISIWYDWHDDGPDPLEPEHHFGTVYNAYFAGREPVFDSKPAYLAARTLTSFFNAYRFVRRLPVGGDDDYVIVFQKGADTRVAAWTTSIHAHAVIIPLPPGGYRTVTYTGQNGAAIKADRHGLSLILSRAPVYLSR